MCPINHPNKRRTADLDATPREKIFYALTMFPYPSGYGLHAGHASVFTINDIIARWKRMQGYTVLNPMGFDSFGLPTENYAMKVGKPAYEVTEENIKTFLKQIEALDMSFDYQRMLATSHPDYYKRTQWIFSELFKAGLVYRDELWVNRCPNCQTVLANDQVVDGKCERCKAEITQKKMPQWFIKITDYADRLIEDLAEVDRPEETKTSQINWIGKSEGAEIDFMVGETKVIVFTTRPDTLYGVTALVLAPENTLLDNQLKGEAKQAVEKYRKETMAKTAVQRQVDTKEKTGVDSGLTAMHPLTGEEIPVRYADYVLPDYATGSVMMVPAHDERDWEFAKKFGIEVKQVIAPDITLHGALAPKKGVEIIERRTVDAIIENKEGKILLQKDTHWHFVGGGVDEGESLEEAIKREIIEETGYTDLSIENKLVDTLLNYGFRALEQKNEKTNSALFHIKVLSDKKIPSEEDEGKHTLERCKPEEITERIVERKHHLLMWEIFNTGAFTGQGVLVSSGQCNGMKSIDAKKSIIDHLEQTNTGRRKITYKLRDRSVSRQRYWGSPIPVYYDEQGTPQLIPEDQLPVTLPLDVENYKPKGKSPLEDHLTFPEYTAHDGTTYRRECDTLDTFMCSSFYFLRYPDVGNDEELIRRELANKTLPVDLYSGGKEHTVGHLLYARFIHKFLYDQGYLDCKEPFAQLIHQGMIQGADGRKMSKRRGNVIDPLDVVNQYGSDAVRTYMMFMGPYDQDKPWNDNALRGVKKFLDKVAVLLELPRTGDSDAVNTVVSEYHKTVAGVTEDLEKFKFNTVVSKFMILVNMINEQGVVPTEVLEGLTLLLAPFATQLAEKLRKELGHNDDVHYAAWPDADPTKMVTAMINLPVQVNGKMRGSVDIAPGTDETAALETAKEQPNVAKYLEGKTIKKVIYVQDKILNIIVG